MRALTHDTGEVRGIGTRDQRRPDDGDGGGTNRRCEGKLYAFATTTCVIRRAGTASAARPSCDLQLA